jgi:hypothetical protein
LPIDFHKGNNYWATVNCYPYQAYHDILKLPSRQRRMALRDEDSSKGFEVSGIFHA